MDSLHLTYEEVMHKVPYRQMVIMQKDKLRVCYGEKMVEVSEEEMFGKGAFKKTAPQRGQNSTPSARKAQGVQSNTERKEDAKTAVK